MAWFSILYFKDKEIQGILDAMILVADPGQKDAAHVTLRGPYDRHQHAKNIPAKMEGTSISIVGAGEFFGEKQNTVFLSCGSELIKKNWKKKSYKGYRPHITIYDGNNRGFAEKLLWTLQQNRLFLTITAGEVVAVESARGQRAMKLGMEGINNFLTAALGQEQTLTTISEMPDWKRITIIERLCAKLKDAAIRSARATTRNEALLDDWPTVKRVGLHS